MRKLQLTITGIALAVVLTLTTITATPAAAATPQGTLQGNYFFVAPGQSVDSARPAGITAAQVTCIWNGDAADYNVGVGFGITGTPINSYNTYQGILLRKWAYCWAGSVAAVHSLIVGNGWCLNWHRWARSYYTDGTISPFGVEVASGTVQGSALTGNVFRTSTLSSYAFSAYLC